MASPSYSATHGPVQIFKGTRVEPYYPPSTYKTFGAGIDHPLSNDPDLSVEKSAVAFIKEQLKLEDDSTTQIRVQKSFSSDVAHHAYLDQTHNGIPFSNVRANVSFNLRNKVIVFGSSFVKLDPDKIAPSEPKVSLEDAIKTAEDLLDGKFSGSPATRLGYLAKEDGSAILTHIFQVRNEANNTGFEASVDAYSGELVLATVR